MADKQLMRQLKIRTGSVKRIHKDLTSYVQEAADQQAKIDKLVASGADEFVIKKQREVLEETRVMVSDSRERLQEARSDLQQFVESLGHLGNSIGPEPDEARATLAATAAVFQEAPQPK